MKYISAQEAASKWGITKRRVQTLCASNRIKGAERIGNMWVLPSCAEKPQDVRFKEYHTEKPTTPFIRPARVMLKKISQQSMLFLIQDGYSIEDAKKIVVTSFASELFMYFSQPLDMKLIEEKKSILLYVADIINLNVENKAQSIEKVSTEMSHFIAEYGFYCDDALAWCYQYINKIDNNSSYADTQFFTEKYMISTLVDGIDLTSKKKIVDPACGGGNFLIYCFEILANSTPKDAIAHDLKENLSKAISKLYGYEIDEQLAVVASISIKLKYIATLKKLGEEVSLKDFQKIDPQIYYPANATVSGALDAMPEKQIVVCAGTKKRTTLEVIFAGTEALFTNPPFQTIKGMPEGIKAYLKEHYPNAKCDMCNAFIELSAKLLNSNGEAGLVTQNSWMYLDSFTDLRKEFLKCCSIEHIWELGSNAFYDLSGEKTNVALVRYCKRQPNAADTIALTSLKTLKQQQIEKLLLSRHNIDAYTVIVPQCEVASTRFDMISTTHLKHILKTAKEYGHFAVPMQGTSTGNAKELIDFYWNHTSDSDWVTVSKGGGYSRWQGLNNYCVKWGKDGEYIKNTKGSAIRNVIYFSDTQMVFSDTGTAGLNVRLLLPNQIFVASGPGIRILEGKALAHLAFLNSRFASYFIRLLSPKLTIAAGYIKKLPTSKALLESEVLIYNTEQIIEAKQRRLKKRCCNLEFEYLTNSDNAQNIAETAYFWFLDDVESEWTQLQCENEIESQINGAFALKQNDLQAIERQIGKKVVYSAGQETVNQSSLEQEMSRMLDVNCLIIRTKAGKTDLGCDGLIEYLSQKTGYSCQAIFNALMSGIYYSNDVKVKYEGLYLHSLVMTVLDYRGTRITNQSVRDVVTTICNEILKSVEEQAKITLWIRQNFNLIHKEAFMKSAIYRYNADDDSIKLMEDIHG